MVKLEIQAHVVHLHSPHPSLSVLGLVLVLCGVVFVVGFCEGLTWGMVRAGVGWWVSRRRSFPIDPTPH